MPELIDRRKLLNTLCKECGHCKNMEEAEQGSAKPCSVHRIISEQPTIPIGGIHGDSDDDSCIGGMHGEFREKERYHDT